MTVRAYPTTLPELRNTHCKRGHPFSPENTYVWSNTRQCKACKVLWKEKRGVKSEPWRKWIQRGSNGRVLIGSSCTKPGLESKTIPSAFDIVWAAGIFEGEGSVHKHSDQLSVGQKDPWILYRLNSLFGGSVRTHSSHKHGLSVWTLCGARARGFAMTIYQFLSPRRKEQVRRRLVTKSEAA